MKHLTKECMWSYVPNRSTLFPSKKGIELNNEKYHHRAPIIVKFVHIKGDLREKTDPKQHVQLPLKCWEKRYSLFFPRKRLFLENKNREAVIRADKSHIHGQLFRRNELFI